MGFPWPMMQRNLYVRRTLSVTRTVQDSGKSTTLPPTTTTKFCCSNPVQQTPVSNGFSSSDYIASNGRINEWKTKKDVKGRNHVLYKSTIPAFAWKQGVRPWKTSVRTVSVLTKTKRAPPVHKTEIHPTPFEPEDAGSVYQWSYCLSQLRIGEICVSNCSQTWNTTEWQN